MCSTTVVLIDVMHLLLFTHLYVLMCHGVGYWSCSPEGKQLQYAIFLDHQCLVSNLTKCFVHTGVLPEVSFLFNSVGVEWLEHFNNNNNNNNNLFYSCLLYTSDAADE